MAGSVQEGDAAEANKPAGVVAAMSPYATGGGGVTFERKVAVNYLARMLTGFGSAELGDSRSVASVAFQQAPEHLVDDLVIRAKRANESEPSLVLALAVRRAPSIVQSDEKSRKLIGSLLQEIATDLGVEVEHRVGLVVAGQQTHAEQLAILADLARGQSDPDSFMALVQEPNRFERLIRDRLGHVHALVKLALEEAGGVALADAVVVEQTWQLLSRLEVVMPRFELPDEADWADVANDLLGVSRAGDLTGATLVRDRLCVLAADYAPKAAVVDLDLLRRDTHNVIGLATRRHKDAWQVLDGLHRRAVAAVRSRVISSDGNHVVHIDRSATISELHALAKANHVVIVHGESGVGKSALVVEAATAASEGDGGSQALVINLRQLPPTVLEIEQGLGAPLATVLAEMSAPKRLLIIDGADAVAESKSEHLLYLVDAALQSDVRILAVATNNVRKLLHDAVAERCNGAVVNYEIPLLVDAQINELVATFPEIAALAANVHARELLRRLVVVDLLIRGGVSGLPVTDGDAMQLVWSGLVRRHEQTDHGMPDMREAVMLRLAELAITGADPLPVVGALDSAALAGLRQDGLLQTSINEPFRIGPEFAHDEVRRYAIARLLLGANDPTIRLLAGGMPRWSLGASRLACQLYLDTANSVANPIHGRFTRLQQAFDAVVTAGHGERWGDVPGEALLSLAEPGPILADAWAELCANSNTGVHRLCRLVDQRFRDSAHLVRIPAVEPLIKQLLGDPAMWFDDEKLQELVRDWLRSLIATSAPAGYALRVQLRSQLVARCAAADQRQREEQAAAEVARAARTPEEVERDRELVAHSELFREIEFPRARRRRLRDLPGEITDEMMVELLALLGPDLGDDGEDILRRIASDEPAHLGPAVEKILTGRALASRPPGFLAVMTESYYLDSEEDGSGFHEDGIRRHDFNGLWMPLASWYYGPFVSLLQSDFRGGLRVINRMLNHAALVRVRGLASIGRYGDSVSDEESDAYRTELQVTGGPRIYVGDSHVWTWYRGTGVGPYPCMSALQALERVCDQLIEIDVPLGAIVAMLLDGCESLAMVGLVVGLLVRHVEKADRLLDPYLVEPMIWHLEFERVVSDSSGFAASSDGIVGADRRQWSLREASMVLVQRADQERADDMRRLGRVLVERAKQEIRSALCGSDDAAVERKLVDVRGWASSMDRDTYSAEATEEGQLRIRSTPPAALLDALESGSVDVRRGQEATRLLVEYYVNPRNGAAKPHTADTLIADLDIARQLIDDPPVLSAGERWDAPAAVFAAALEANLVDGIGLPDESLKVAAETIMAIAGLAGSERQFDSEESYFEQGADRVVARVLPLFLLPIATRVRALLDGADGSETYARVVEAATGLASALPNEVRVHLARGLDALWQAPCSNDGSCHHEAALVLIIATMRDCAFGDWDPASGRRTTIVLEDPIAESLQGTAGNAIYFHRLDAALRALAPASVAGICVSDRVDELFTTVLAAQRRALLAYEQDMDSQGAHALIAARALLTIVENGDDTPLFDHLDAFADRSDLLGAFVRAISAAAEESSSRAAIAARLWPELVRHVLGFQKDHEPFDSRHYGDYARASLIPNSASEVAYHYRELDGVPIVWWDPNELSATVEDWLPAARGSSMCLDHLVNFIRVVSPAEQVRIGLPWIADLVLDDPEQVARRSYLISGWLIDVRPAISNEASLAIWQRLVDALVVAGDSKLAPYSQ